jgi:N-acetyl-anhydromuramyl-L-alanine amidase AmpD
LEALEDLLAWLLQAYPDIPLTHPTDNAYDYPADIYTAAGLVAHSQVQPWNKSDPGPYFPWVDVMRGVSARLSSVPEPSSLLLAISVGTLALSQRRRR